MIAEELNTRRVVRLKHKYAGPPLPIVSAWVFCNKSAEQAGELAKLRIAAYWQTIVNHYQMHLGDLKGARGYEFYGAFADAMEEHGTHAI